MSKRISDLKYGDLNEIELTPTLQKFFNDDTLEKVKETFGVIDFIGEKVYCELKSRRINHNQYPTCLIGCNKIKVFQQKTTDCYIVYKYLDGLFYIKYDDELFLTFKNEIQNVWRDGRCEKSNVLHIPVSNLQPLTL
tara:strand:- start:630 stop:1040 length:411 start_codon:yes stop_codon:yes gene_type:complete